MIVDIEYPATHSNDSFWWAVDKEGNVGVFFTGEPGFPRKGCGRYDNAEDFTMDLFPSVVSGMKSIELSDEQIAEMISWSMPFDTNVDDVLYDALVIIKEGCEEEFLKKLTYNPDNGNGVIRVSARRRAYFCCCDVPRKLFNLIEEAYQDVKMPYCYYDGKSEGRYERDEDAVNPAHPIHISQLSPEVQQVHCGTINADFRVADNVELTEDEIDRDSYES